jgi:hypothetical protein
MTRIPYFENIKLNKSPLLLVSADLDEIIAAAANNETDELLSFASKLADLGTASAKARAAFIRLQIGGIETEDLFEEYRESWGIPKFEDDLVTIGDFKNGFLWTFRDHTSTWTDDVEAREWFYTNIEARFARRYEYWSRDHGREEMLLLESGDYKNILYSIIDKHADYSPFASPVFSHEELRIFYDNYDEDSDGFFKESLIEIMKQNINWEKSNGIEDIGK